MQRAENRRHETETAALREGDFGVALGNARAQAAEMVIPPGDAEGGPGNRHRGADQWLFVVAGTGTIKSKGRRAIRIGPGSVVLIEHGDETRGAEHGPHVAEDAERLRPTRVHEERRRAAAWEAVARSAARSCRRCSALGGRVRGSAEPCVGRDDLVVACFVVRGRRRLLRRQSDRPDLAPTDFSAPTPRFSRPSPGLRRCRRRARLLGSSARPELPSPEDTHVESSPHAVSSARSSSCLLVAPRPRTGAHRRERLRRPLPCIDLGTSQFCSGTLLTRVESFDGVPLDVNVTLPPAAMNGPFPLIVDIHGWGIGKSPQPFTDRAAAGYITMSYSARGFHFSCGFVAARLPDPTIADPNACNDRGWIRLADARYEVRDTQYLAGLLADEGLVIPNKVAATGSSYGGGQSMILAALRNRVMMPDGSLVPWTEPGRPADGDRRGGAAHSRGPTSPTRSCRTAARSTTATSIPTA